MKKEAAQNLSLGSKAVSKDDDKVRNMKMELLEEKTKHSKVLSEVKDKLSLQKQENSTAIGLKTMMISKLKIDHQIEVNAEKLKSEKLILLNKNLLEKVAESKDEILALKDQLKEFNKINILSIKNKVQLENEYKKAGIR